MKTRLFLLFLLTTSLTTKPAHSMEWLKSTLVKLAPSCTSQFMHDQNLIKLIGEFNKLENPAKQQQDEFRKKIESAVANGANINAVGEKNNTILHYAVATNKAFLVSSLLEMGADPNLQNDFGYTSLHSAALSGSHKSVTKLLKREDVISGIDTQSKFQDTPLHLAAVWGESAAGKNESYENYKEVVKDLIFAGANPELKNNDNRTPLEAALDLAREKPGKKHIPSTAITQCIAQHILNKKEAERKDKQEKKKAKENEVFEHKQQKEKNKQKLEEEKEAKKQAVIEKQQEAEEDNRKQIEQEKTLAREENKRQEELLQKQQEEQQRLTEKHRQEEHKRKTEEERRRKKELKLAAQEEERKRTEEESHKQELLKKQQAVEKKRLEEERNRKAKEAAEKEEQARKKQKEENEKKQLEKAREKKERTALRKQQETLRQIQKAERQRKAELEQHQQDQVTIQYFVPNLMAYLCWPQPNSEGFQELINDVTRLKLQLLDLRDPYGYPIEYGTGKIGITFGRTPLHHAVAAKNLPVIKLFLDNGADPRANLHTESGVEIDGTGPWDVADAMQKEGLVYGEIA
ncbi:ankyrin repeat domain-containing protein, partial [Candidatus Babeliales bacterium]|nr:ankyrin repeat domain-containing protein [Candidatus Babeliales bacterium]